VASVGVQAGVVVVVDEAELAAGVDI